MATAYCTEAHERCYHSRTILVENATPVYRREEREAVKKLLKNGFMIFSVNMCQVRS